MFEEGRGSEARFALVLCFERIFAGSAVDFE